MYDSVMLACAEVGRVACRAELGSAVANVTKTGLVAAGVFARASGRVDVVGAVQAG